MNTSPFSAAPPPAVVTERRDRRNPRADLDDLFRAISHDLRAPVRHLGAFGLMLRERLGELGGDGEALSCLDAMDEATQNLGRMIDGVLELSRIARAPLLRQPMNVGEVVDEVRGQLSEHLGSRIVEWHIADHWPDCQADVALVRQLFERLLANAVKFTRRREVAMIAVGWHLLPDNRIEYFVRDNGAGFNQASAEGLFGIFKRLHTQSDFDGLGVGLAGARQIVERHGGRIGADATLDVGCTVRFTLG
ncbi:two-component sensor histidine kinase [Xylophilus rhododendri]|uniref:histidine kinase n=1 Tax=Xylophilus rhododendri TaxID=2697032 RepID=A0A857J6J4_9BURK|nr:ATP-binding protein [Xylophilus rhododendri]QHI99620.1 two-component sensor histidine kinase [Xylophilus rhododendri]